MTIRARRGFAAMNREKHREISRKGGQAAHAKGTAHEFDVEEARRAGVKGGRTVSADRAHMAAIGRKGAQARAEAMRLRRARRQTHDVYPPAEDMRALAARWLSGEFAGRTRTY